MIRIKETIIVEGKDDVSAVRKAVDANIIPTHGYGISPETLELIRRAYETTGIIILTDPDHAGKSIREKLTGLFPEAKQAFLTKKQAYKKADIGIENALPEDIGRAILAVTSEGNKLPETPVTEEDMEILGLTGRCDSKKRREEAGAKLGIGYANAKTFLKRIGYMGISRETLYSCFYEENEWGREVRAKAVRGIRIVLASASPRRRDILRKVVPMYESITADVDERKIEEALEKENAGTPEPELARLMVERLSLEKARAVFVSLGSPANTLVIGADTTVVLPDEILGKPLDRADAVRMLRKESVDPQSVITGVSFVTKEKSRTFSETSRVVFYPLDAAQEARIQEYADTDEPYDKAGGYGIQALGDKLVERFEGSFDNIIGLPTERLRKELEAFLD